MIIPLGLLSMAMQALVFAWAYPKLLGSAVEHGSRGALRFGLVFGSCFAA